MYSLASASQTAVLVLSIATGITPLDRRLMLFGSLPGLMSMVTDSGMDATICTFSAEDDHSIRLNIQGGKPHINLSSFGLDGSKLISMSIPEYENEVSVRFSREKGLWNVAPPAPPPLISQEVGLLNRSPSTPT